MERAFILVLMVLQTALGAAIGHKKNRLAYGITLGLLLGFIGCIIVACSKADDSNTHYDCPACGERILMTARVCKHCKTALRKSM